MTETRLKWASWTAVAIAILTLNAFATSAIAGDLDQYRATGVIIERYDGTVEAAPSAPADAQSVVGEVNAKRRDLYNSRAQQNGAPVSEVAKVYAQQIFSSAPSGTKFRRADGSIVQK